MILGVDYASIDGNASVDFATARRWGVRFAMLRAAFTYSGVPRIDATWTRDHAAARAAGLQVAPYLILSWSADPVAQVDRLIGAYGEPGRGDLPVALDVESVSGVSPAQALAKVEAAVSALRTRYPTVMIYTSNVVWTEQLGDLPSEVCGACPLWLKVGYPWRARNPPHLESVPPASPVPRPWRTTGSPGAFLEQFQGDAVDVPGFTRTVDLSVFLTYTAMASDLRTTWVRGKLEATGVSTGVSTAELESAIRTFQEAHQLSADAVIGPATWAAICAPRSHTCRT